MTGVQTCALPISGQAALTDAQQDAYLGYLEHKYPDIYQDLKEDGSGAFADFVALLARIPEAATPEQRRLQEDKAAQMVRATMDQPKPVPPAVKFSGDRGMNRNTTMVPPKDWGAAVDDAFNAIQK